MQSEETSTPCCIIVAPIILCVTDAFADLAAMQARPSGDQVRISAPNAMPVLDITDRSQNLFPGVDFHDASSGCRRRTPALDIEEQRP